MKWLCLGLFFLIGGLYISARPGSRLPGLLKPWLIPPLLGWALFSGSSEWLVLTGLILGCMGDVLLDMPGEKNFLGGLCAFLLGHVAYAIFAMGRLCAGFAPLSLVCVVPVCGAGVLLCRRLWPDLGKMKAPVCAYCAVIGLMTVCGLCLFFSQPSPVTFSFAVGSVFFMISDSILAIGLFQRPFPRQGLLVMSTYLLAQFLITLAIV